MKKVLVLLVLLATLVLVGCNGQPSAKVLPVPPGEDAVLLEYSVNEGGTWLPLARGDDKDLEASILWLRKTEVGTGSDIRVVGVDLTLGPEFEGSIVAEEEKTVIVGDGPVWVYEGVRVGTYAKILLK